MTAGDDLLAGQVSYYRRRASEYDVTAYGDLDAARARITRIVAALRPAGNTLEIACGTGMWTSALAGAATAVTAIDAAPEMIDIARGQVTAANVRFEVADVFSWAAAARFDTVFFAFWLSHVPASRLAQFWGQLHGLVTGQGRVLFVDEHPDVRDKEAYAAGSDEIIHRRLADGSEHRLVKVFNHPGQLRARLHQLGWRSHIRRDGKDWVIGEARPATRSGRTPRGEHDSMTNRKANGHSTAASDHEARLPYQAKRNDGQEAVERAQAQQARMGTSPFADLRDLVRRSEMPDKEPWSARAHAGRRGRRRVNGR